MEKIRTLKDDPFSPVTYGSAIPEFEEKMVSEDPYFLKFPELKFDNEILEDGYENIPDRSDRSASQKGRNSLISLFQKTHEIRADEYLKIHDSHLSDIIFLLNGLQDLITEDTSSLVDMYKELDIRLTSLSRDWVETETKANSESLSMGRTLKELSEQVKEAITTTPESSIEIKDLSLRDSAVMTTLEGFEDQGRASLRPEGSANETFEQLLQRLVEEKLNGKESFLSTLEKSVDVWGTMARLADVRVRHIPLIIEYSQSLNETINEIYSLTETIFPPKFERCVNNGINSLGDGKEQKGTEGQQPSDEEGANERGSVFLDEGQILPEIPPIIKDEEGGTNDETARESEVKNPFGERSILGTALLHDRFCALYGIQHTFIDVRGKLYSFIKRTEEAIASANDKVWDYHESDRDNYLRETMDKVLEGHTMQNSGGTGISSSKEIVTNFFKQAKDIATKVETTGFLRWDDINLIINEDEDFFGFQSPQLLSGESSLESGNNISKNGDD